MDIFKKMSKDELIYFIKETVGVMDEDFETINPIGKCGCYLKMKVQVFNKYRVDLFIKLRNSFKTEINVTPVCDNSFELKYYFACIDNKGMNNIKTDMYFDLTLGDVKSRIIEIINNSIKDAKEYKKRKNIEKENLNSAFWLDDIKNVEIKSFRYVCKGLNIITREEGVY